MFLPLLDVLEQLESGILLINNGNSTCQLLGLKYEAVNQTSPGCPDVVLGDPTETKRIVGDGNCLFRAFSQIITGRQRQHHQVRLMITQHMLTISDLLIQSGYIHGSQDSSAHDYLVRTRMNNSGEWGSDVEMMTMAHLLKCRLHSYSSVRLLDDPSILDKSLPATELCPMSMYVHHNIGSY